MSRDRLSLRANFPIFSAVLQAKRRPPLATCSVLISVCWCTKRDCTNHFLRVERHGDGGYREADYGSLRPRNVSVPSYRPSMLPLLSSPLPYVFLPACFERCVTSPRPVWRLPVALGPHVSNDLLSVRARRPVTRFSMRLSTRAGRPIGGDPIYSPAFSQGPDGLRAASTSTMADV